MSIDSPPYATNVDGSIVLGKVPFAGTVSGVQYIANAAITGQDTNTRRIAVTNRKTAGDGTNEVAALQFNNAVNAAKWVPKTITLNADPTKLVVAAGDILTIDSTTPGTGVADPGGTISVDIVRDDS
jgi:hypothetical protein